MSITPAVLSWCGRRMTVGSDHPVAAASEVEPALRSPAGTSTVAEVPGRPARTFLEWAVDHAAEFGPGF